MSKKIALLIGGMFIVTSCDKSNVKSPEVSAKTKQLLGAPQVTKLDERAKHAENFVRLTEKDLGKVIRYRRQTVAGVNHYFEFSKIGKMPMEIIVFENLKGKYKITSKSYLE